MHMITTKNTLSIQFLPSSNGTYESRYNMLQAEQTQILSRISHDLLNSLTLLNSSYQFIEAQHPEAANFQYWTDLKSDTKYIQHYLNSLSKYNKAAALKMRECDLNNVLNQAVQICFSQYPEAAQIVSLKSIPLCLNYYGDDMRLTEAVAQVLLNSFEAIKEKENIKKGKITVSFQTTKKFYKIRVQDNADGITESSLPHVCEPLFTEKPQHAGLGLTICSRIFYAHNGHLKIDSKIGRGTTVTLCLPIRKKETSDQTDEA